MCTTKQHYDSSSRVELVSTEESSEEIIFDPVCTDLLKAPSLNSILKGNVTPIDNVEDIEKGIWLAETPETFLRSSLQFLENKLHSRIYQARPSPSGKVVLSEGFIFTPIYPPVSPQESQTRWEAERVTRVHNLADEDSLYSWHKAKTAAKRVDSVAYSCISITSECGNNKSRDQNNRSVTTNRWCDSLRNVAVQTSNELLTATTEMSSVVSDEETKPIHTFSEYVEYCQTYVKPPSQLFSFTESSQNITDNKFINEIPDTRSLRRDSVPSTHNDTEVGSNSARTYLSHHRSSPTEDVKSSGQDTHAPYDTARGNQQLLGQNSRATESDTTMSSVKSTLTNKTGYSENGRSNVHNTSSCASSKSVYYYARISASFFAFLTRATQKNKRKQKDMPSSVAQNTSSATTTNISTQNQKYDRSASQIKDDGKSKLTPAKIKILRRFMNFFGGAKSSKEYEKVNDPSATVVDVTTGFFNDDHLFDYESTLNATEHKENKIKCSSFPVPVSHRNEQIPGWSGSVVSSEITVEKKELNQFLRPNRKLQPKPKPNRHIQRVNFKDTDQCSSRTTLQDLTLQQQITESHRPDVLKGKPSPVVSSIFGSNTSYSKTVCKDILRMRFEGDRMPVTATDTSTDCLFEGEIMNVSATDTTSSDDKFEVEATATDTTSTEGQDCCICLKSPTCSNATGFLPNKLKEWHREQSKQTVLCATNQYVCYARFPENHFTNGSCRHQQNAQTEQPKKRNSIQSLFKYQLNRQSTCSSGTNTASQSPTLPTPGRLILKPKPPILNHNTHYFPKLQETETQESDPQSTKLSFYSDESNFLKPKKNLPQIRKQNTYLIEKPQVYPDKITRLMPENEQNIWAFPSMNPNHYQESAGEYDETTRQVATQFAGSADENTSLGISNLCEETSSACSIPYQFSKIAPEIPSYKYNQTSKQKYFMNIASSSSSDFDAPTNNIYNAQSNSSRSSYWLPPKRQARDSRDFPNWNPLNSPKVKQSFSKEVIKLFQRSPKPYRK